MKFNLGSQNPYDLLGQADYWHDQMATALNRGQIEKGTHYWDRRDQLLGRADQIVAADPTSRRNALEVEGWGDVSDVARGFQRTPRAMGNYAYKWMKDTEQSLKEGNPIKALEFGEKAQRSMQIAQSMAQAGRPFDYGSFGGFAQSQSYDLEDDPRNEGDPDDEIEYEYDIPGAGRVTYRGRRGSFEPVGKEDYEFIGHESTLSWMDYIRNFFKALSRFVGGNMSKVQSERQSGGLDQAPRG